MNASWWQLILVVSGGAVGTLSRFVVSSALPNDRYPWGTTAVNLAGACLFGVLWSAFEVNAVSRGWYLLLLSGFMGAFTTFSTWAFELSQALHRGRLGVAFGHLLVHVVFGVALVAVGMVLGRMLRFGDS